METDTNESALGKEEITELAGFFDLLARFDYEGKMRDANLEG